MLKYEISEKPCDASLVYRFFKKIPRADDSFVPKDSALHCFPERYRHLIPEMGVTSLVSRVTGVVAVPGVTGLLAG